MDARTLSAASGQTAQPGPGPNSSTTRGTRRLFQVRYTTVIRVATWCTQLGHESGGLQWMGELADGSVYEWRQDLGNVYAGDSKRYKCRGPIPDQIICSASRSADSEQDPTTRPPSAVFSDTGRRRPARAPTR